VGCWRGKKGDEDPGWGEKKRKRAKGSVARGGVRGTAVPVRSWMSAADTLFCFFGEKDGEQKRMRASIDGGRCKITARPSTKNGFPRIPSWEHFNG